MIGAVVEDQERAAPFASRGAGVGNMLGGFPGAGLQRLVYQALTD